MIKKESDAKIVFVTTTFVPEREAGRFQEDAIKYNKVGKNIMLKNGVIVNDIYDESILIHKKLG